MIMGKLGMDAGSSLVKNGIGALFTPSLKQQRRSKQKYDAWYQHNITEKNMALENQYQIDAENRANAYNDPSAYVARMKAAGLNPTADGSTGVGMSASSGPSAGGGASGSFSQSRPGSVSSDFEGFMQAQMQKEMQKKQIEWQDQQTEADLKVKEAQARKLNADAQGSENTNSIFGLTKRIAEANANSAETQSRIAKLDEAIKGKDFEKAKVELDLLFQQKDLNEETKENLIATRALIKAQEENQRSGAALNDAKTQTEDATREPLVRRITNEADKLLSERKMSDMERAKFLFKFERALQGLPEDEISLLQSPWAIVRLIGTFASKKAGETQTVKDFQKVLQDILEDSK